MAETTGFNDNSTNTPVTPPAVAPPNGVEEESVVQSDDEVELDSDDESDCSDETDLNETSQDIWEQEGMLHYHVESSYLDGIRSHPQDPYVHRRIVNYDRCKSADLKRFVKDRLLPDPYLKGVTLKYFYIRVLERADRVWSFRLMDLPPEMRMLVYRNLFRIEPIWEGSDRLRSVMHPAILRACKQIYQEAKGVLYNELVFTAHFTVVAEDNGRERKGAMVHTDFQPALCAHAKYFRMPQAIDNYPDFLKRISHLEIKLTYAIEGTKGIPEDGAFSLGQYLYTLASFLMDGHQIKYLHLKLELSAELEDQYYSMVLSPLRRLRNIPNVTISGHIPPHMERKLVRDLKSAEPTFNTMRYWKLVVDEAEAQLSIHDNLLHEELECGCGECVPECINDLYFYLGAIDEAKRESYVNSRLEENLIARLAKLRKALNRVNVANLETQIKTLTAKRAALKEYEAVTDDGRLEEAEYIWEGETFNDELKYGSDHDWSDDDSDAAVQQADTKDAGEKLKLGASKENDAPDNIDLRSSMTVSDSLHISSPATPSPQYRRLAVARGVESGDDEAELVTPGTQNAPRPTNLADTVGTVTDEVDGMVEAAIRLATARVSPDL